MKKIQLLPLLLITSISLLAQSKDEEPSFSSSHRSTTLAYGVSALFGGGAFKKDGGEGKTLAAGPLIISFNKALTDKVSFHWGPAFMYYRNKYDYRFDGAVVEGSVSHLFGGLSFGLNYHFATTGKLDPYAGASAGAGYYYGLDKEDPHGYSLDGSIPLLYGAKLGINAYDKSNNAWTVELGYDYLAYLKVGYTFVKQK